MRDTLAAHASCRLGEAAVPVLCCIDRGCTLVVADVVMLMMVKHGGVQRETTEARPRTATHHEHATATATDKQIFMSDRGTPARCWRLAERCLECLWIALGGYGSRGKMKSHLCFCFGAHRRRPVRPPNGHQTVLSFKHNSQHLYIPTQQVLPITFVSSAPFSCNKGQAGKLQQQSELLFL